MAAALDALFGAMLDAGASDLHLSVGVAPSFRVRGELVPHGQRTIDAASMQRWLEELLTPEQREQFARDGDLDFAYAYGDRARFRCNYLQKTTGPGAVFRTIPTKILSAEQLGLAPAIVGLADLRAGLVLVTGPTGSGKSTTLAALVSRINHQRAAHILTIEDPVEFVHPPANCLVTHREVGLDCAGFEEAIRSAGRENADVVLVGELRGAETMRMALQMASYGVLVFATVHTNSAPATIDRFINVFPANQQPAIRGMLAESLAGVVAQQLLRRSDGRGRVAAHEVLIGTPGVRSAIREGKTAMLDSLMQGGARWGMQMLDRALEKLVADGVVSGQDALERARDKESFGKLLAARGSGPGPA
jgi:twitching motility protein PilT